MQWSWCSGNALHGTFAQSQHQKACTKHALKRECFAVRCNRGQYY